MFKIFSFTKKSAVKNSIALIISAFLLSAFIIEQASAAPSSAISASGAKFITVDVQKVLSQSEAVKEILDQIEKKRLSYHTDITKKEKSLKEDDQKLAEQRSVLSEKNFEEKALALRDKAENVKRDVQTKLSILDKAYGDAMKEVHDTMIDIIDEIAREKNVDMVLQLSNLLYTKSEFDFSNEVLKKLNSKLPKVKVDFSVQP